MLFLENQLKSTFFKETSKSGIHNINLGVVYARTKFPKDIATFGVFIALYSKRGMTPFLVFFLLL